MSLFLDGPPEAPAPPPMLVTAAEVLAGLASRPPQRTFLTPWASLDRLIAGGVKSRQLTTICGPTGSGKTGLAGELALKLSLTIPVLIVATEIDVDEQAARLAAQTWRAAQATTINGVPKAVAPDDILAGRAPADLLHVLDGKSIHILFVESDCADPFDAIIERMNQIKAEAGTQPALIIDYLQMLDISDEKGRRTGVSAVANRLRQIAQGANVPVIAVSSVSRAFYGQNKKALDGEEDPRAWLAAAKESGDVEYASAVLSYLDTSSEANLAGESPARLIVAKSRRGRTGYVGLRFHGASGHFRADDGATEAMGPGARMAALEQRVLQAVEAAPQGVLRTALRERVGGRGENVDAAVERLLGRKVIAERPGRLATSKRKVNLLFMADAE